MTSITVEHPVKISDAVTRTIYIEISNNGAFVSIYGGSDIDTKESILWENLSDVASLADLFSNERVKVFKVLVEMLGKAYSNKDVYMGLL